MTTVRIGNVTTHCEGEHTATCFYVYCENEAESDFWWGGSLDAEPFTDWHGVVALLTSYYDSPIVRIKAEQ
jgi:hypothetical protein